MDKPYDHRFYVVNECSLIQEEPILHSPDRSSAPALVNHNCY